MPDIDRNATDGAQKWAQHRFVIKLLVDDVTNGARTGELEDEGVYPADVIWQQEAST